MKTVSTQLDTPINPPPRQQFSQDLEHTVGEKTYLYAATARKVDIKTGMIFATVTLTKYERVATQWWRLRNRNPREVWSISTSAGETIYEAHGSASARSALMERAIGQGILLSDLLLERLIRPIEQEAREEHERLTAIRFGRHVGLRAG